MRGLHLLQVGSRNYRGRPCLRDPTPPSRFLSSCACLMARSCSAALGGHRYGVGVGWLADVRLSVIRADIPSSVSSRRPTRSAAAGTVAVGGAGNERSGAEALKVACSLSHRTAL